MDECKKCGSWRIPCKCVESKVSMNVVALDCYLTSMNCAIIKAKQGSECEDGYFIEKLEKMCTRLGFDLVKRAD
jgi:hypothetical protein